MSQPQLLKRVTDLLAAAGVPYMVTGSVVSSSQGQPRATHDIDLVVQITPAAAMELVKAFPPPDYYLDEIAVREAIARRDMFNLLDIENGDKVDFFGAAVPATTQKPSWNVTTAVCHGSPIPGRVTPD